MFCQVSGGFFFSLFVTVPQPNTTETVLSLVTMVWRVLTEVEEAHAVGMVQAGVHKVTLADTLVFTEA